MKVIAALLLSLLAVQLGAAASVKSTASPSVIWQATATPCNGNSAGLTLEFGMPCYHASKRVAVFPHFYSAPNGSQVLTMFVGYDLDNGSKLWEFCTATNGQYCTGNVENSSYVYLGSSASVWAVDARSGNTEAQLSLPSVASPAIVTAGPRGHLYITNGGGVIVTDKNLNQLFTVGNAAWQHVGAFNNGLFYYNNVNPADGRSSLVVASVEDGSTLWQTYANSDNCVGTNSIVTTASFNTNPNVVTAYSAITGKKLWETVDFYDYDARDGVFVGVYPDNLNISNTAGGWTLNARDLVTGERTWTLMSLNSSPPTVMGSGFVFVHGHSNNGPLSAVKLNNGELAWQFTPDSKCKAYNGQAFENYFLVGFGGAGCTKGGAFVLKIRS